MPTKPELEAQNAELASRIAELEARLGDEPADMPDVSEYAEQFRNELDEYQAENFAHRFDEPAFVRAYIWARIRKRNDIKASLVYADAHEQDFEESDAPVVKRD